MKTIETSEIKIQGAHQLALRRMSVKVFDGAMKVSIIRAPCDSGADADSGVGETAETGSIAMCSSLKDARAFYSSLVRETSASCEHKANRLLSRASSLPARCS